MKIFYHGNANQCYQFSLYALYFNLSQQVLIYTLKKICAFLIAFNVTKNMLNIKFSTKKFALFFMFLFLVMGFYNLFSMCVLIKQFYANLNLIISVSLPASFCVNVYQRSNACCGVLAVVMFSCVKL